MRIHTITLKRLELSRVYLGHYERYWYFPQLEYKADHTYKLIRPVGEDDWCVIETPTELWKRSILTEVQRLIRLVGIDGLILPEEIRVYKSKHAVTIPGREIKNSGLYLAGNKELFRATRPVHIFHYYSKESNDE